MPGITVQKLSDIKGLSEAKVEKLLDAARKLCTDYGWRSATRVEQQVDTAATCASHSSMKAACRGCHVMHLP